MKVETASREFRYNGVSLKDPNPAHTLEQVRAFYAALYPEIISAAIEGPENAGNKLVYEFRKAVGTKGGSPTADHVAAMARAKIARDTQRAHAPAPMRNNRYHKLYRSVAEVGIEVSWSGYAPSPQQPLPHALPMIA